MCVCVCNTETATGLKSVSFCSFLYIIRVPELLQLRNIQCSPVFFPLFLPHRICLCHSSGVKSCDSASISLFYVSYLSSSLLPFKNYSDYLTRDTAQICIIFVHFFWRMYLSKSRLGLSDIRKGDSITIKYWLLKANVSVYIDFIKTF